MLLDETLVIKPVTCLKTSRVCVRVCVCACVDVSERVEGQRRWDSENKHMLLQYYLSLQAFHSQLLMVWVSFIIFFSVCVSDCLVVYLFWEREGGGWNVYPPHVAV